MPRQSTYGQARTRPRRVWFAASTGIILCASAVFFILLPLAGVIGAGATAAPFVRIPLVQITLVVAVGCLLSLVLLYLAIRTRRGWIAWSCSITAIVLAVAASIYPAVAVALTAGSRAAEIIPWLSGWIGTITS